MSWLESREVLETEAQRIDKSIRLYSKTGRFWETLGSLLAFLHLMSKDNFMCHFATTIGPIQVYPVGWTEAQVRSTIQHESRHTKQARWFGLGLSPWLGVPLHGLFYFLLPIPILFAFFRFWLELDAETARWRWWLARGATSDFLYSVATNWALLISSSAYGWAIPFSLALWIARRSVERLLTNTIGVLK